MKLTGISDEAGSDIHAQIKAVQALGWSALELRNASVAGSAGGSVHESPSDQFDLVAAALDASGIGVAAIGSTVANWARSIDEPFAITLDQLSRVIPRARRLGARLVRIMSYAVRKNPDGSDAADQRPAERIRRLREIWAWMEVNAEAVRGTRPAGLPEPDWGRLTRRDSPPSGSVLYAHVYRRPADGRAVLAGIHKPPDKAYVLETRQDVKTRATEAGLVLDLPDPMPDDRISVVALEFKSGG